MSVRIAFYVLASWLSAAHFLRGGDMLLVALCLAAPLMFCHRRRVTLTVLQLAAYLAAANWMLTAWRLIEERTLEARSWTAAALILGIVAATTAIAGALLNADALKKKYPP